MPSAIQYHDNRTLEDDIALLSPLTLCKLRPLMQEPMMGTGVHPRSQLANQANGNSASHSIWTGKLRNAPEDSCRIAMSSFGLQPQFEMVNRCQMRYIGRRRKTGGGFAFCTGEGGTEQQEKAAERKQMALWKTSMEDLTGRQEEVKESKDDIRTMTQIGELDGEATERKSRSMSPSRHQPTSKHAKVLDVVTSEPEPSHIQDLERPFNLAEL